MIPLSQLNVNAENKYYEAVEKIITNLNNNSFPFSCKEEERIQKLDDLFEFLLGDTFKDFILSPYDKLCDHKSTLNKKNDLVGTTPNYFQVYNHAGGQINYSDIFYKYIFAKFSKNSKYLENILGTEKINIWLAKQHDIMVCPYCNINYIYSRINGIFGAQLDHFFPRNDFPIFSICLYNLVPSCSTCNNAKRTYEAQLSPFDSKINFRETLQFSYQLSGPNYLSPECVKVKLKYIGEDGAKAQKDMGQTGVESAYQPFNTYAHKVLLKSLVYNENHINMLLKTYPDLFSTRDEILALLYGYDFFENEELDSVFRTQSVSRLTHDLMIELGIV